MRSKFSFSFSSTLCSLRAIHKTLISQQTFLQVLSVHRFPDGGVKTRIR